MQKGRKSVESLSTDRRTPASEDQTLSLLEDYAPQDIPNWPLIDEISIKLLEEGIGCYDILQRVLPSIVLSKIDSIKLQNTESDGEEAQGTSACTGNRLLKLFKLAQMEIEYLLRTQTDLLELLTKEKLKTEKLRRENKVFKKDLIMQENSPSNGATHEPKFRTRELFKPQMVVDRLNFSDHIKRRHGSNLEAAAGSAFRLPVTGEMLVDEGSAKRSHSIPAISMNDLNDSFWKESPRNSNDDGADDSSQSLWHG